MRRVKILSIFVILAGLIILSPAAVFAATAASADHQRIYSVTEIDSPSPYHTTLVVRTGLATGNVWIQCDTESAQGILLSYGESQRVWQISYVSPQGNFRVAVYANHDYVMDESLISWFFQHGHVSDNFESRETATESVRTRVSESTRVSGEASDNVGNDENADTPNSWRGINIIGDERFVERTLRAMRDVERGPSWAYDYVVTYLNYVRQCSNPRRRSTGGHINVRTRTFYVFTGTYSGSSMWYAGALVHEAIHARQYREYLESRGGTRPRRSTFYSTFEEQYRLEMEALDIQIRFLEEAGAPGRLVNSARSFIGTVWWR